MGDPAGIGGEIAVAAWAKTVKEARPFYMICDPEWLRDSVRAVGADCKIVEISDPSEVHLSFSEGLPVIAEPLAAAQKPGIPEPKNAAATIRSIERAVADVQAGRAAGVVTNPINKKALYDGAGFAYPGHTEFLGYLAGVERTVMMLASPILRVVPVTIHVSLREACKQLSTAMIVETARILDADLKRYFGLAAPRIAVSGLNPHAGEGGAMGDEEISIIEPAIAALKTSGIDASGPWPGDTMFHEAARAQYDVALCMYHDQALIPLKALDFANGVNVTLGLPFIRTSPDHGTAYNIAGTGAADPSSLIEALRVAANMAQAVG
jgi:4-hydroxythreonine-4-phosphate dehydrogenase